jgi:hypothetical protein
MTRGILLRAFAGLAGVFLIGTALAACAASPTHAAAPLTGQPSTSPSSTIATTPTTSVPPVATTHPRPKPKPPTRHVAPRTTAPRITAPRTSSAPAPVTTKPAPPRTTAHAAPPPNPSNCDPAYPGVCLKDGIGDYDCAGGSGNGPNYVDGPITVRAPDPFGLDSDHDGVGCE